MSLDRGTGAAFIERYGRTWQAWDVEGFCELFSDDVVYVAHPEETVVGASALRRYVEKEKAAQGSVRVRMGNPMVDGDRVMGEFWVQATNAEEQATIAGCLIAQLSRDGSCTHFREYWFDIQGHAQPFAGWGE